MAGILKVAQLSRSIPVNKREVLLLTYSFSDFQVHNVRVQGLDAVPRDCTRLRLVTRQDDSPIG